MQATLLGMLNTPEIILILVLALILFGAKKLPELAKGLGHGIKEFRKASREISDELNSAIHEEPPPRQIAKPVPPAGTETARTEGDSVEENKEESSRVGVEPPVSKG
jgi:sec-independent protein translocase protein TatA